MFTLNPSLRFIEAAEHDVVAVYRSISVATVAFSGKQPQPSEAYVCTVKKNSETEVYLAFRSSPEELLVYAPEEAGSCEERVRDALGFAESLGFTMESVNLNCSKALREVIIRNLRICRSSLDARKVARPHKAVTGNGSKPAAMEQEREKAADEKSSDEKGGVEQPASAALTEEGCLSLEKSETERAEMANSLAERLEAEKLAAVEAEAARRALAEAEERRAERERILAEKAAAEKLAAEQAEKVRLALESAESERAERERLSAEKEDVEKRAAEQAEAARLALAKAEAERAERERILAERSEAEKRAVEQLEAERRAREQAEAEPEKAFAEKELAEKLAAEQAEVKRAELDKSLAEKESAWKISAEQAETARRRWEQVENERIACEKLLAEKAEAVKHVAEQAEAARIAFQKAEAERAGQERIFAEKAEAERRAAERIEAARRAWEESEAARVESEMLLAGKAEAERSAAEEADAARLALEEAEAERAGQEKLLEEKAEAAKHAQSLADAARLAWECAPQEAAEREGLPAEQPEPEKAEPAEATCIVSEKEGKRVFPAQTDIEERARELAAAALLAQCAGETVSVGTVAEREVDDSPFSFLGPVNAETATGQNEIFSGQEIDSGPFSFAETCSSYFDCGQAEPAVSFMLDGSLAYIAYEQELEATELYRSSNMTRVKIEGYPLQSCAAYLCTVERGRSIQVYVALFLSENGKVLVYAPEKQPETTEECGQILRGGMAFAETVGFMMERVELGDEKKRAGILAAIPVLHRSSGDG